MSNVSFEGNFSLELIGNQEHQEVPDNLASTSLEGGTGLTTLTERVTAHYVGEYEYNDGVERTTFEGRSYNDGNAEVILERDGNAKKEPEDCRYNVNNTMGSVISL